MLPVALCAAWLLAAPARAQRLSLPSSPAPPSPPSDDPSPEAKAAQQEEQARVYFSLGAGHYKVGEYDAAIAAFQAGYRLAPLPLFLFNIAQSARRAGNHEMAIEYYQKYIESETLASAPQLAEARLQVEQLLSAGPAPPTKSEPPPQSPAKTESPAKPAPVAKPALAPPPLIVTKAPPPSPPHRRGRGWMWGTIAGVTVAGMAVGLGLGFGLQSSGPRSSLGTITF
jgi:hypothetical protein